MRFGIDVLLAKYIKALFMGLSQKSEHNQKMYFLKKVGKLLLFPDFCDNHFLAYY